MADLHSIGWHLWFPAISPVNVLSISTRLTILNHLLESIINIFTIELVYLTSMRCYNWRKSTILDPLSIQPHPFCQNVQSAISIFTRMCLSFLILIFACNLIHFVNLTFQHIFWYSLLISFAKVIDTLSNHNCTLS